jgi:hypothetical protein
MNNENANDTSQEPALNTAKANESAKGGVVGMGCGVIVGLVTWFFFGGFFSVGPRIAHGIEHTVGNFVLDGVFLSWIALPFTVVAALVKPTKATAWAMGLNIVAWVAFLAALYLRWGLASRH